MLLASLAALCTGVQPGVPEGGKANTKQHYTETRKELPGQNINFGINPPTLSSFLDAHTVDYAVSATASKPMSRIDITALAQKSTVQVQRIQAERVLDKSTFSPSRMCLSSYIICSNQ